MSHFRRFLYFVILAFFPLFLSAQEKRDTLVVPHTDSISSPAADSLSTKDKIKKVVRNLDNFDTSYITPNYYNYTVMLQNTNFMQRYTLGTKENTLYQGLEMSPHSAFKIGPYFGWRWIFLGYTFDVSKPPKAGRSSEFSLSIYSAKIGFDYVYTHSSRNFIIRRATGFSESASQLLENYPFTGMKARSKTFNAYYIFNHRKFSYPAAYNQSTVQRKSAGSWKIGFRYDRQELDFDETQLPELVQTELNSNFRKISVFQKKYSLSFGYAYNWVPRPNFLVAGSLSPAFGYTIAKGESFDRKKLLNNITTDIKNLNLDLISRIGIVYNNSRWFAGSSLIHYFFNYKKDNFYFSNSRLYINVYVGYNFGRRKRYRNVRTD